MIGATLKKMMSTFRTPYRSKQLTKLPDVPAVSTEIIGLPQPQPTTASEIRNVVLLQVVFDILPGPWAHRWANTSVAAHQSYLKRGVVVAKLGCIFDLSTKQPKAPNPQVTGFRASRTTVSS